jgi:hypothetical protein
LDAGSQARLSGLSRRTMLQPDMSDFAIHPMAAFFGEADALLSMTILRIAAEGGGEAIIDQSDPLAMLAAKR